jgi:hypothetical protein
MIHKYTHSHTTIKQINQTDYQADSSLLHLNLYYYTCIQSVFESVRQKEHERESERERHTAIVAQGWRHESIVGAHIVFVGTILDFSGNCRGAIDHRMAQAEKAYHRCKLVLFCRCVSLRRRVHLAARAVLVSLLWLAETWHVTKAQDNLLGSWGARLMARVAGVRRNAGEEIGQFWRRLHRVGHNWMRFLGGGVPVRRRLQLHRFAGHCARLGSGLVRVALRTSCLAWWRFQQNRFHSKWHGLHPRRFYCWRWEAQFADIYGDSEVCDPYTEDVG